MCTLSSNSLKKSIPEQVELFPHLEEARLYHDTSKFGFFSILTKPNPDDSKKIQRSYRLTEMANVLPFLDKNKDSWISQNEFILPNRRIVNLARLCLLFVDIDCYKMGIQPERALDEILDSCDNGWDMPFPPPSISIMSGRGLQLKWLHKAVPMGVLPRWNAMQTQLVDRFVKWGADHGAKDASRVLRLVDTVNTKSGQIVRILDSTLGDDGNPKMYDFEFLAEHLLPGMRDFFDKKKQNHPFSQQEKEEMHQEREKREAEKARKADLRLVYSQTTSSRSRLSTQQLAWDRLKDIRKLISIRGGVTEGQSMPTLFYSLNFLALAGAATDILKEAKALCSEFKFGEFNRNDELTTLLAKSKDFASGKKVIYQGREYPALYTPKNSTLIDLFEITNDEMRQLKTIITKEIKTERLTKKRREAGVVPRQQYLAGVEQQRVTARLMKAQGVSIKDIAAALKAHRNSVTSWLK